MGIGLVADEGSVFIEKELTEGTYVPEASDAAAVEVLSDGLEFTPSKELLERNNRTSTVETVVSRVGQKSMAGTVPTELKAGITEGAKPETSPLYEALLGGKAELSEVTSLVGHTANRIYVADNSQYKAGYIVKINESDLGGVDVVTPITEVGNDGADYVDVLVAHPTAYSDNVVLAAAVNYYHQSGQPTLSVTNYLGGKIREKAIGMRAVSAELSNFSTGQLPEMSFSLEGLDFDRNVGQPLFTPAYDSIEGVEPPVVLCSKIYKNDQEIEVNSVGVTMTNTLGFLTSTASCSGKIKSRITKFAVGFTIDPYMQDDEVENFDLFVKNEAFSIFGSSSNYGATKDIKKQVVAFNMPNCRLPEITTGDQDGILTDSINGTAHKTLGNDTIFIAFI